MSQYTTEQVLEMMERWYEEHKDDEGFNALMPFKGFDRLLGADLNEIDLSRDTIEQKAEHYTRHNLEKAKPPWKYIRGIDFRGALLSKEQEGSRVNLNGARLEAAYFVGAQLEMARLPGAWLQRAYFVGAQLGWAHFGGAQLERADFSDAQLKGALFRCSQLEGAFFERPQLEGANFTGAQLDGAEFGGARLGGAYLRADVARARFEDVEWDRNYVLGYELERNFRLAEPDYRRLKQYYNGTGQYDLAGEFHKRELLMRRKGLWEIGGTRLAPGVYKWVSRLSAPLPALSFWTRARTPPLARYPEALVLYASAILMGHGERPSWVVGWVFGCFAAFAAAYWLLGALPQSPGLVESIRHSAQLMVSFGRREGLARWVQDIGLVQSFISYVLLALFLVTFVRKVSPR